MELVKDEDLDKLLQYNCYGLTVFILCNKYFVEFSVRREPFSIYLSIINRDDIWDGKYHIDYCEISVDRPEYIRGNFKLSPEEVIEFDKEYRKYFDKGWEEFYEDVWDDKSVIPKKENIPNYLLLK